METTTLVRKRPVGRAATVLLVAGMFLATEMLGGFVGAYAQGRPGAGEFTVSWTVAENATDGYELQRRRTRPSNRLHEWETLPGDGVEITRTDQNGGSHTFRPHTGTTYVDDDVYRGEQWEYRVRGWNPAGDGPWGAGDAEIEPAQEERARPLITTMVTESYRQRQRRTRRGIRHRRSNITWRMRSFGWRGAGGGVSQGTCRSNGIRRTTWNCGSTSFRARRACDFTRNGRATCQTRPRNSGGRCIWNTVNRWRGQCGTRTVTRYTRWQPWTSWRNVSSCSTRSTNTFQRRCRNRSRTRRVPVQTRGNWQAWNVRANGVCNPNSNRQCRPIPTMRPGG